MKNQKLFSPEAAHLTGTIDLLGWLTSLASGVVQQMSVPMSGAKISSAVADLFTLAEDEAGLMLASSESEAPWLESQPFSRAFIGFDDQLILVTSGLDLFEARLPESAIGLCIPDPDQRSRVARHSALGFGLIDTSGKLRRVSSIISVFTPERFHEAARSHQTHQTRNLFTKP